MEELYQLSKNLSIDESMVLFRGRLMFHQDTNTGLVHRVLIYSGEGTGTSEELSHTEYVVEKLMEGYYYKGHSIYMDNYYNSVKLAHYLLEKQTYCTGTLRANRKNNPKAINDKKFKKGETICQYTEKGVGVVKWKDRRDVIAISSEHSHDLVNITNRRGIIKSKPLSIIKYNEYMSGIDRQDQMLSYYPCERKTLRWYKKLGIHFIQILLLNWYLLYNKNRCRLCSSKGVRKMTSFYCSMCEDEPGFCLDCFEEFHRNI
ncbi:piggyBac transposable element-derived protein 4-like [Aphis craccivora]|uniref:PiggyBac transposable element-derived protein 4-like n=1 Tax=Aphis craccivora TaxID=307492 RepID=A0A6G0W4X6_APHCR|nr:piggyBac transposable element-derived protein 4-like [Aphis craccivora]